MTPYGVAHRRPGPCWRLDANHYTIRHGHASGWARLQSWVLEASADAQVWWLLRTHTRGDPDSLPEHGFGTRSWPIRELFGGAWPRPAMRYFRVRMIGPNSDGHHSMSLGGFELYGDLRFKPL